MRKSHALLAAALAASLFAAPAMAAYPDHDVTVVIPKNPGGGTDLTARGITMMMEKDLKSAKFVPVNKPDGNGIVGMVDVSKAKPDGYTLGMVTVELAIFPHQKPPKTQLTYDAFESIIAPIAAPAALIVPKDAPYDDLNGFVEYLKKHPGEVMMGNSGMGAIWHVATLAFENAFGVKVKHIPYPKGTADIAAAMAGKHINGTLADPSSFKTQIEAGNLKILAVMSEKRTKMFPDVPTFKELGHDMAIRAWATLVAPKGTPKEVLDVLRASAKRVTETKEFTEHFLKLGIDPTDIIGEDANKMMKDDDAMFEKYLGSL
ncbi:MAG: tripartite tricarboxylate transporter substrate binding protein [Succinivibrionaceae bacterium]|nr:tripartite tricarboxylate transporter substrate binding protein [Succinivibrionaceae bacterium]